MEDRKAVRRTQYISHRYLASGRFGSVSSSLATFVAFSTVVLFPTPVERVSILFAAWCIHSLYTHLISIPIRAYHPPS